MAYSTAVLKPFVRENNAGYSTPPFREMVYEVSLRTAAYNDWLGNLPGAHRLLQALLRGQILGHYRLWDFLIRPEGLFARVTLEKGFPLSEFLDWVKDKSLPPGESRGAFWDDGLQWIRLVPPERLSESNRLFTQKIRDLGLEWAAPSETGSPLLIYYRDRRFNP